MLSIQSDNHLAFAVCAVTRLNNSNDNNDNNDNDDVDNDVDEKEYTMFFFLTGVANRNPSNILTPII